MTGTEEVVFKVYFASKLKRNKARRVVPFLVVTKFYEIKASTQKLCCGFDLIQYAMRLQRVTLDIMPCELPLLAIQLFLANATQQLLSFAASVCSFLLESVVGLT